MNDSNKEISPILTHAIEIMEKVNEGLKIEIIGEVERTKPYEHYPIGQLGISTRFKWLGMEENFFLPFQLCEDIISYGHLIAQEVVMSLFLKQFKEKFPNIGSNEKT